jgi:MFS family permease
MLYGVVIFFGGFPFGVSAAAIQDITPNQMRGQIAALYLFAINFAGIGTGPMVIALFTDKVFHDDLALRYSLVCIMLITLPLALVLLVAGLKPYRRALARGVY